MQLYMNMIIIRRASVRKILQYSCNTSAEWLTDLKSVLRIDPENLAMCFK